MDIFVSQSSLRLPLRTRCGLFVFGIAWELLSSFLPSVCLEKGDSLVQLWGLENLLPSYGEGCNLSCTEEKEQSRALAKRHC